MKKLSTGDDSTLGNYLRLVNLFFGTEGAAAAFLKEKIADSPNGPNEDVIADEGQMLILLQSIEQKGRH